MSASRCVSMHDISRRTKIFLNPEYSPKKHTQYQAAELSDEIRSQPALPLR